MSQSGRREYGERKNTEVFDPIVSSCRVCDRFIVEYPPTKRKAKPTRVCALCAAEAWHAASAGPAGAVH